MAIRPDTELAPNVTAATASFPLGSSKNETAPGSNDGTPYNLTRADDIFGFQQALLKAANIVASGNTDTALNKNSSQYLQAMLHQVLSGFVFDESGAADVYVLDVVGNNPAPADYEANMTFRFVATNTNTGASTVDVESLGVKNIFADGAALTGGEIIVGNTITITFDVANDRFNLITTALHDHTNAGQGGKLIGLPVQIVSTQNSALATGTTVIPIDDSKPQNTEGDEYMTLAITPKNVNNRLVIEVIVNCGVSGNLMRQIALFQDSIADALDVASSGIPGTTVTQQTLETIPLRFEMVAGTISSTTFKVRAGGTSGTFTFNGHGGSRMFGGAFISSITITEYQA